MFTGLGTAPLVLIFATAAAAAGAARSPASSSTDSLDFKRTRSLAVATNLPETAIVCSAALAHNLGIAIGNILGGSDPDRRPRRA